MRAGKGRDEGSPTVDEGNNQRQMGLIKSKANGRDALWSGAKLVAKREQGGGQKKRPAPKEAG